MSERWETVETTGHCGAAHPREDSRDAEGQPKFHSGFSDTDLGKDSLEFGKNRIFTWVPCPIGEETLHISDAEVVEKYGVPQRLLIQFLRTEIENEQRFLSMPLAIILVIVYSVSLAYHDGATTVRDMEDAITFDIRENANFAFSHHMGHKGIDDAHTIADVHSWLRLGLRPLLFKHSYGWSEDLVKGDEPWASKELPRNHFGAYMQYNKFVGGMVLQQVRAGIESCRQPSVADILGMVCQPAEQVTGILNLHLEPNHFESVSSEPQYDPKLTRWFLIHEDEQSREDRFKQLEISEWINNSTAQVSAHFLSYNAHFDTLTLTSVHFYFARSGHIWKKITHMTYFLELFQTTRVMVSDIFFSLIIVWLLVNEIREASGKIFNGYHRGVGAFETLREYLDIWNVVDWITIGIAIALGIMCVFYGQALLDLKSELMYVTEVQMAQAEWTFEWARGVFTPMLSSLMDAVRGVHAYFTLLRTFACFYPVALVLRLFKAFQAQPRLSIVTKTLMQCSVDVAHFAVVFFAVYTSLAVMGMALFGREIEEFSTFDRAFTACFVVLMGDFDVKSMWAVGRPMATLWFVVFMVGVLLIMLNMLLAIIMDAYSEVKATVQSSDTLCFHVATFWRRSWELYKGERVSLPQVHRQLMSVWTHHNLDVLAQQGLEVEWEANEILFVDTFQRHVSGLQQVQAQRLMEMASRSWRLTNETALTLSEVQHATNHMMVSMNKKMTDHNRDITRKIDSMNRQIMALYNHQQAKTMALSSSSSCSSPLKDKNLDTANGTDVQIPVVHASAPMPSWTATNSAEKTLHFPDSNPMLCDPGQPHEMPSNNLSERLSAMEARFSRLEAGIDRLTAAVGLVLEEKSGSTPERLCGNGRGTLSGDRGTLSPDLGHSVQSPPAVTMSTRGCCGSDLRPGGSSVI